MFNLLLAQQRSSGEIRKGVLDLFETTPIADKVATGGASYTIAQIVGQIGAIAVAVLGVVALGYIVYAGYLWFDARGNPTKVEEAKKTLRNAAIGVILVLIAGFLVTFFLSSF